MQRRKDKSKAVEGRCDSRVVSGEAGRSGEPEGGTSAREVMGNEGREVGSGVERSVVQNALGKVDVDVGIAGNRVIGTDGRVGDKDDKVVGSGRSDASTADGTMMGQEASGDDTISHDPATAESNGPTSATTQQLPSPTAQPQRTRPVP